MCLICVGYVEKRIVCVENGTVMLKMALLCSKWVDYTEKESVILKMDCF